MSKQTNEDRKAEIKLLLETIENQEVKYYKEKSKADKENFETAKKILPELKALEFNRFEINNFTTDKESIYEFRFETKNRASLSIDINKKKIRAYSTTGCSDYGTIDPADFEIVKNYYSDVSVIMDFFSNISNIDFFYEIAKEFKTVNYEEYHTGLSEYKLKEELNEIIEQERIDALNLKVGSIIQYLEKNSKGRFNKEYWVIAKIETITTKRFSYRKFDAYYEKWEENDFQLTTATIDYKKIKELNDNQKEMIKGK